MFSKRIVISIIVIGCLVQHIICTGPRKGTGKTGGGTGKTGGSTGGTGGGTGNGTKEGTNQQGRLQTRGIDDSKPPLKKNQSPSLGKDNTADIQDKPKDPKKEESNDGYVGKAFKIFGRFKNFTKRICPFRFAGRVFKKTMGLDKKKSKSTNDDETEEIKKK